MRKEAAEGSADRARLGEDLAEAGERLAAEEAAQVRLGWLWFLASFLCLFWFGFFFCPEAGRGLHAGFGGSGCIKQEGWEGYAVAT